MNVKRAIPGKLTVRLSALGSKALSDLTLVLEVEVPCGFFALIVLQVESDDGLGLVKGILAVGLAALERLVDDVEGSGRRVGIYRSQR